MIIRPADFGTFFLMILLVNFILLLFYYAITKCIYSERPSIRPLLFLILSLIFWGCGVYFYTQVCHRKVWGRWLAIFLSIIALKLSPKYYNKSISVALFGQVHTKESGSQLIVAFVTNSGKLSMHNFPHNVCISRINNC